VEVAVCCSSASESSRVSSATVFFFACAPRRSRKLGGADRRDRGPDADLRFLGCVTMTARPGESTVITIPELRLRESHGRRTRGQVSERDHSQHD